MGGVRREREIRGITRLRETERERHRSDTSVCVRLKGGTLKESKFAGWGNKKTPKLKTGNLLFGLKSLLVFRNQQTESTRPGLYVNEVCILNVYGGTIKCVCVCVLTLPFGVHSGPIKKSQD